MPIRRGRAPVGKRKAKDPIPKGVKRRHLERVDNYEYSLPDNFEDEEIGVDEAGGYDEWDNPSDAESDLSAASGDEGDLITLTELWDQNEQESEDEKRAKEEDEEEEDEEMDEESHSQFVDNIKAIGAQSSEPQKRFKQMEIVDKRVESEHNIQVNALNSNDTASLSLPDLISALPSQSTEKLRATVTSHAVRTDNLLLRPPLHEVEQDRLVREAAYTHDKNEISKKWESVVRDNRSNQISFPALYEVKPVLKTDAMMDTFNPTNEFEKELAGLLQASGQDVNTAPKYDELPANKLTPEQAALRAAELRKMKALISYEVQKATRIKKIHSKTYRKIHKKAERIKEDKMMMEYLASNPEAAAEEVQKMEMARIEERMSLKHKNTSKWIRTNLKRGKHIDPVSRQAIEEQLSRGRDLTKKMASADSEDEGGEDEGIIPVGDSEEANVDFEDPELQPAAANEDENRRRRLARLTRNPNVQIPTKGLYGIKFMKRAMDRSLDEAEKRLNQEDDYDEEEENKPQNTEEEEENLPIGRKVFGNANAGKPTITPSGKTVTISGELVPQVSVGHKARVAGPITTGSSDGVGKVVLTKEQTNKASTILNQTQYDETKTNVKPKESKKRNKKDKSAKVSEAGEVEATGPAKSDEPENPWMQKAEISNEKDDYTMDVSTISEAAQDDKLEIPTHDDTDIIGSKEEYDDEQTELLRRAFAEDDVVEEFNQMNESAPIKVKSGLATPGWGKWAGEIDPPKKQVQTQPKAPKNKNKKKQQQANQATQPNQSKQANQTNQTKQTTPAKENTNKNIKTETISPNNSKKNKTKTNNTNTPPPPANNKRIVGKPIQMKKVVLKKSQKNPAVQILDAKKLTVPNKYQVTNLPFGIDTEEEFKSVISEPLGTEWIPTTSHAKATAPRIKTKPGLAIAPITMTDDQEKKYQSKAANYVKKYHKSNK